MYSELLWSVRYLSPVGTQKSLIEVDSMPACVIIFKGRQSMAPGKGKNCFLQSGLSITKLYCKKQKKQINSTSLHSKHFSTRPCHAMQIVTDLSAVDLSAVDSSAVHCSPSLLSSSPCLCSLSLFCNTLKPAVKYLSSIFSELSDSC